MGFFNKIAEVFTKKYRKETKYREDMKKQIDRFKLSDAECIDYEKNIAQLRKKGFESNFHIKTDHSVDQGRES